MKNIHQISFSIKVGKLHDRAMGLVVKCNTTTVYSNAEISDDLVKIEIESGLPLEIRFETSGKNWNDTIVDPDGNIIQDKFLLVDSVSIDGIWIKKWIVEQKIFAFVDDRGSSSSSNYFGANGVGVFSIPYHDILEFWLDTLMVDQNILGA